MKLIAFDFDRLSTAIAEINMNELAKYFVQFSESSHFVNGYHVCKVIFRANDKDDEGKIKEYIGRSSRPYQLYRK